MMNSDEVISLYESVSELTGQMLTAAQQRDWENRQILAHDRAIRDLTTPWMAQLAALIGNAGAQRKLSMSYGSHQQF